MADKALIASPAAGDPCVVKLLIVEWFVHKDAYVNGVIYQGRLPRLEEHGSPFCFSARADSLYYLTSIDIWI